MGRRMSRVSNQDLATAIKRLEVRQDNQEEAMKQLETKLAPLHDMLIGVQTTMKMGGALLALLSAVGTAVGIWAAFRGH